jgi:membrane-associated phospholipid phosphatase
LAAPQIEERVMRRPTDPVRVDIPERAQVGREERRLERSHHPMRRRLDVLAVVAGIAIVVPCGLLARDGTVGPIELAVFHAINGLPDALSPLMRAAQLLGVLAAGPIAATLSAMLHRWRLALACLLVTAGKLVAERGVWEVVQRSRPGTSIADAIVRGNTPASGASFVSGHVVLLTGLAWVVTPYLRGRWRFLPWTVVALVALARIYLGAHAPLDVLGGVGVGLIVGGVANLILGTEGVDRPPVVIRRGTQREGQAVAAGVIPGDDRMKGR